MRLKFKRIHGGANLYKCAAFEAAKDVIEKGYLIFNDVNKRRDSYYFAAPVDIDGRSNIVVALVHRKENGNRFYLHSVGTKESLLDNRVSGLSEDKSSNTSTTYPRGYIQALQNIFNVNKNVSKVVDENGDPLAVYHGTPKFDRFNIFKKGSNGYLGPAIYFTNLKASAQKYENKWGDGGNLYDVFLSLENPLIVKSVNPAKEILKTIYGKDGVYDKRSQKQSYDTKILTSADIKKLQSKGYDGVINKLEKADNIEKISNIKDGRIFFRQLF